MHKLVVGKSKEKPIRQIRKPKPVRYLSWRDMPYEGCGPMYEYPHYCPVHLFAATSPPELMTEKPLSEALVDALKKKFEKLDAELKEEYQENESEEKILKQSSEKTEDPKLEWKSIPRKTYRIPLANQGDSSTTATEDKSTNVRSGNQHSQVKQNYRNAKEYGLIRVPHFRAGLYSD